MRREGGVLVEEGEKAVDDIVKMKCWETVILG